jgi:hypothetical protein
LAVDLAALVWLVGFRRGGDPPPVLVEPVAGASADAEVVGTADGGVVYAAELGIPPNHRIVTLDVARGELDTAWTVPPGAIIYSMAHRASAAQLALAYTSQFGSGGNGIHLLELEGEGSEPVPLVPEVDGRFFTDLAFGDGGSTLWATAVEREGDTEQLSVVSIDLPDGEITTVAPDAVGPAPGDGWVAYMPTEDDGSRQSIERLDLATGAVASLEVLDGSHDLDHLLFDPAHDRLVVAALLLPGESGITVGEPAAAHGDHAVPSQWVLLDRSSGEATGPLGAEPVIVWDATVLAGGAIAYTTGDGLSVLDDQVVTLVSSNAMRIIAAEA